MVCRKDFFFFFFFFFFFEKKTQSVSHIAHRGGIDEHTENSLWAFQHSTRLGVVNVLELDVRLTKDHKIVIAHDPGFHRLLKNGGSEAQIAETNYDDLPLLPCGQKLCLLETLLNDPTCSGMPISLDFKVAFSVLLLCLLNFVFCRLQMMK